MPNAQDEAFVQLARRRGLLTGEQLQAANDLRVDVGLDEPIAQLLLQGKLLAPAVVAALLRDLTRGHFACERCGDRVPYDGLARLNRLSCPRCGGVVTFVDPSAIDGEPRPTGGYPAAAARATGRHAARPTGAYPASTGAYPASTGAYPGTSRPTGAFPAAAPRPTGAHEAVPRPTGAHPAVAARTTGRHMTRPSGPHPPQEAPAAVPPPEAWDAEATVIDRNRRSAAQAARAPEPADTVRGAATAPPRPIPLGEAGESTIRDARVLGLPGRDRTIGPYVLIQEVGRGAGGVIYLAKRPGLERRFAVKLLLGEFATDEQAIERFKQEAAVASKVDDPGIVAVYDTGCDAGRYYYAMEYCAGPTLEQRLEQGPLPADEAAQLVLSLARTVQAAHDRAVIHRDLKPANVILEEASGRPRVTDFGVARDASRAGGLSRSGELLGTPVYMAPEQIVGARDVDARVDVYALGVILFECVAGRLPHQAPTTIMLAEKVVNEDAPPLSTVCPGAPAALDEICRRALARDRAERYESARAMARDLERFLGGRAVRPRADRRAAPRRTRALGAAAAAALAIVAVAVGAHLWSLRQAELAAQERRAAEEAAAARARALAEQGRALGRALALRQRPLDELRDEAKRLSAEPDGQAPLRAVVMALEAIALSSRPAERPLDEVLADIEAAISAARDDVQLQAELHLAAAHLLLRRARYPEALAHSERALAEPGRTGLEARLLRAAVLTQLGREAEGNDVLEKVAREDPDGTPGLLARSTLASVDRHEEALGLARRAIEREPKHPMTRMRLAVCLLSQERLQEAQGELSRHLEHVPDDQLGRLFLALTFAHMGRIDEARAQVDRAIALCEPRPDPQALYFRAELRASKGDVEGAIQDLDRAAAARPDARTLFFRGALHDRRGESARAEADWQQANALDPLAVEAHLREAPPQLRRRIQRALGRPDFTHEAPGLNTGELTPEVEALLAGRAAAAPEAARAPLLEALRKAARGLPWAEVDAALMAASNAAPDAASVVVEMARVAVARDAYDRAAPALARARELGASSLELERLEAELHLRRGRLSEAERQFRALSSRDASGAEGLVARAEAERLAGRVPAALEAVEAALARDPGHTAGLALKGELLLSLERPDVRGALDAASRGLGLVGASDSRLMVLRFRCMAAVAARDIGDGRGRDVVSEQRFLTSMRELNTLLELSAGAGPVLAVASLMLDWEWRMVRLRAGEFLRLAGEREPDRPELHLLIGRYELLVGERRLDTILEAWRRARQEPLLRVPPRFVAEFKRVFGERPELEALVTGE